MRVTGRVWVWVWVSAILWWPTIAAAQAASLQGRVTDAQGAGLGGALVKVVRSDSGIDVAAATTTSAGRFEIVRLSPGTALLQVERAGFRRAVRTVTLTAGTSTDLTIALELDGVNETIVVTAAGVPQSLRETSKALTSFDRADMRARQYLSIADVVRTAPGVQVRQNGGPGQLGSLRLRGLRSEAGAVLVDGFRLRDAASTQADATAFFSTLSVMAIDRAEVLRGSGSSLYGTNAVGGVLNLVTLAGGGPLTGDAQIEYGSLGQTRGRAAVTGSAWNQRVSYAAGGLGWDVSDGLDGDDAARTKAAQGAVAIRLDARTTIWARYMGSSDRVRTNASPSTAGIPATNIPDATVVDAVAGVTFLPGENDPDADRHSSFQTMAMRLEHLQTPALRWQASYQHVRTNRTHRNGPLGPGFQNLTESVSDFAGNIDTLDARGTIQVRGWLTASGGYEFERETYFEHIDDNAPAPDRLITESDVAQTSHAAFGALQAAFADRRLLVSVSGRLQGFRLSAPRFSTVGTVNPYAGLDLEAPPHAATGDVAASYFLAGANTKLRAHAGNAYRAPSLYERFGGGFFADPDTRDVIFSPFGDPRLAPERYRTIDAGVDQYLFDGRATASVTFFDIDAHALTEFDFSGDIDPASDPFGRFFGYLNGSGGTSRGVELSLDARPARGLSVRAAYTHTTSETEEDLAVPGFFKSPNVFGDTASLVVTHDWRSRLATAVELFHASESYTALSAGGRARAYRFPGFTTLGLTSSYRLTRAGQLPVRAYVRLDNLFGEEYFVGGWRQPGRTGSAGVSLGF